MKKVFWYVLFGILFFIFASLTLYLHFMGLPDTCKKGCDLSKIHSPWMNGDQCQYVLEKYEDSTIVKPTLQPYLRRFTDKGPSYPFCNFVWYAFRYVRNKDGGYGPLSNWSGYNASKPTETPMPIFSGANTFPCVPVTGVADSCSQIGVKTGSESLDFNLPTISLVGKFDFDINSNSPDGYTLNVHRQVDNDHKGFDPDSEGDIVGSFIVKPKPSGAYNTVAEFIDAFYNPNSTKSSSCK